MLKYNHETHALVVHLKLAFDRFKCGSACVSCLFGLLIRETVINGN